MPATSASDTSYSTPATSSSTPSASAPNAALNVPAPAFHVALAVVLGVVGLALCVTVGILVARERRRHQAHARSTPSVPVEGVKTPADAWASMATFETALRLPADEKAVYACADEKASAPKPSKRTSVPHIQIQVTTSSSWVIEQDLTELWAAARRDASAPQRESVPFDLDVGSLKGRS